MRYQTSLFLKDGGKLSEIVRASDPSNALEKMACTKDIAYAPRGYAHPLDQTKPQPQDWRWHIRCSVSGRVTMSSEKSKDTRLNALQGPKHATLHLT